MKIKLFKIALTCLVLALVLPVLMLSFMAVTVKADCGCGGGGDSSPPIPPVTKSVRVDVSPQGAGDVEVGGQLPPSYPVNRTVVLGESVSLEASPADGYYFVGWSGDLTGSETPVSVRIDTDKIITAHFFPEEIVSEDNRLHLVFPVGTVVQDKDGEPLTDLEIAVNGTPLPTPPEANFIGLPYELGPHGASFGQPVSLSCSYDPSQIPPRVAEEELAMAYYDEDSGQWLPLPSVVDVASHIVTTLIDHLSTFAIISPLSPPLPAAFTPSALTISPLETDIGETVDISVLVTNTGELEGSYSVVLTINGVVEETREITLAGGSQTVSFSVAGDEAGAYYVDVNGLEGSFTVKEAPLLPIVLPSAVVWAILGLALAALVVSAVVLPIVLMCRRYY